MSGTRISAALRQAVRERAAQRCEYCRMPDFGTLYPHEPDHVGAEQHGGETTLANLALACFHCNRYKGPNIASLDWSTRQVAPLFHPRKDRWVEHFRFTEARIIPLTINGRVTANLLKFNTPERWQARLALWQTGCFDQM